MRERGIQQWALAKMIGASQAGVSQALSPKQHTSVFVVPISEALGIKVPAITSLWIYAQSLQETRPEALGQLAAIARTLVKE